MKELSPTSPLTGGLFWISISTDSDVVVIGSPGVNKVYLFVNNEESEIFQLDHIVAGSLFGQSVSISNNTIVVGIPNNNSAKGSVALYVIRNGILRIVNMDGDSQNN